MAFVASNQNQADPIENQDGQQAQQQAPVTSAPNASGAGKATAQPSNSGPSQPFTNLSSYLTANAPQIQAEGQQIAGGLTSQYGQVTNDINAAGQKFNNQVNAGYTPMDQNVLDTFNANPTAVANDPTKAASFKGMYGDSYTGPGTFESTPDYLSLSGQVQDATTNAKNLQTPAGIQSYFSASSPTYTQGMGTLDAALLQGNPGVVSDIGAAAKPFENLPGYLTSAALNGDQAAQSATQQAQAAKAATQKAFTDKSAAFGTQLQGKLDSATKDATKFNTNFNDIIARLSHTMPAGMDNGIQNLTPEEEQGLGIDNGALGRYTDANTVLNHYGQAPGPVNQLLSGMGAPAPMALSSYLRGGNTAALPNGIASVASGDDYAMAQALSQLAGQDYTSPLNPADAGKAGTYVPGGHYQTFDSAGANSLFDQISSRDTALADNYLKTSATNLKPGDYSAALNQELKDPTSVEPGTGASYILSALNRLVNGFNAPPPGYTPPPADGGGLGIGRGGV